MYGDANKGTGLPFGGRGQQSSDLVPSRSVQQFCSQMAFEERCEVQQSTSTCCVRKRRQRKETLLISYWAKYYFTYFSDVLRYESCLARVVTLEPYNGRTRETA